MSAHRKSDRVLAKAVSVAAVRALSLGNSVAITLLLEPVCDRSSEAEIRKLRQAQVAVGRTRRMYEAPSLDELVASRGADRTLTETTPLIRSGLATTRNDRDPDATNIYWRHPFEQADEKTRNMNHGTYPSVVGVPAGGDEAAFLPYANRQKPGGSNGTVPDRKALLQMAGS